MFVCVCVSFFYILFKDVKNNEARAYSHYLILISFINHVSNDIFSTCLLGQNKNRFLLGYVLWRVKTGRHKDDALHFQIPVHTRCLIDAGFANFKRLYRYSWTLFSYIAHPLIMYCIRPFLYDIIQVSLRFSQFHFTQCIGYNTNSIGAVTKSVQMCTITARTVTNKLRKITLTK